MEKIFGYDIVDGKYVINLTEAEMLKYRIELELEYAKNPPPSLVEELYQAYSRDNPNYTREMAVEAAKHDPLIGRYIAEEMQKRFAAELEEYNRTHPQRPYNYIGRIARPAASEEIVDKDTFEQVQAILKARETPKVACYFRFATKEQFDE